MSDLLNDNVTKSMDEEMIYVTKLKLLNEPCIIDDISMHTLETYHDNNSINSINEEAIVTESNESFFNTSISSPVSKKLNSSLQNQINDICSKKEMNFTKSILETVSTQQSSQIVSNDFKSRISADEISQLSHSCYTARVILPKEMIDHGFNFYQISNYQQISKQSDKNEGANASSESEIAETNNDIGDEAIESENRFYDFTETVRSSIQDVKCMSKATESSSSLVVNSEYCIPRMNETSAMIITGTPSFYLYKATDPFRTLYNTDEAQWSSFIPHNDKAWR
ncbi:E3 ubiquitin-protein ligase [Dirofilaria immitis]